MKLVQNLSKFDQELHETTQNPSKPPKHRNLMKILSFIMFLINYFGKLFLSSVVAFRLIGYLGGQTPRILRPGSQSLQSNGAKRFRS